MTIKQIVDTFGLKRTKELTLRVWKKLNKDQLEVARKILAIPDDSLGEYVKTHRMQV